MSDVLPPPPPPRGNSGAWKWVAIACGGCCLGAVVLFAVLGVLGYNKLGGVFRGSFKAAGELRQCQIEMPRVWKAIQQYHKEKGAYPDSLSELVPNYITNVGELKLSLRPDGPEFTYHKPTDSTPDSDPMLEYTIPVQMTAAVPQKITYFCIESKGGQFTYRTEQTIQQKTPGGGGFGGGGGGSGG